MNTKKLNDALKEKTKIQIINCLMRGNASYSDIMSFLDESDSGRVNYHLKAMIDLGLVRKDEEYTLTQDGERFGMYAKQFELKEQYPIPVACCMVKRDDGKILMVKRAKKPFINYWIIPGGKINHGESSFVAAKREVLEECGIEVNPTRIRGIFPTLFNEHGETTHHFHLVLVEADFVEQHEHSIDKDNDINEYAWFTREEIKKLKIVDSNKIFFEDSNDNQGRVVEQTINQ